MLIYTQTVGEIGEKTMDSKVSKSKKLVILITTLLMVVSAILVVGLIPMSATADIPDYDVEVTMSSTAKEVRPGYSVQYPFTVKNVGAKNDQYKIMHNLNASGNPLYYSKGWRATITPTSTGTLQAITGTISGQLTVTAPANASVTDLCLVDITIQSKTNSTVTDSIQVSTSIKRTYSVAIETPAVQAFARGNPGSIQFNVTNTGNDVDKFDLTVDTFPSGWGTPTIAYSKTDLNPDENMSATLNFFVPYNALAQQYAFQVKATSNANNTVSSTASFGVNVNQIFNVNINTEGAKYVEIGAGNFIIFNISVQNTGNGYDSFNMDMFMPPARVVDGWSASVGDSVTSSLAPNEYYNTTLTVYPPAKSKNPQAGDIADIYVNATSVGDSVIPISNDSAKSSAIVAQDYSLTLNGLNISEMASPGTQVKFKLEIVNTGNGEDHVQFDVPVQYGWTKASISPNSLTIQPGTANKQNVNVTMTVPNGALSGDPYTFTLYSNSTLSTASDYQILTVDVDQVYNVKGEPQPGYSAIISDAYPGNSITYDLRVVNIGNGEDDFDISIFSNNNEVMTYWDPTPSVPSVEDLLADEFYNFTVTAAVPYNATTGNYFFTVNISSRGDPSQFFLLPLTAKIPQLYNVDIDANKDNIASGFSTDTTTKYVYYNLSVYNTGSGEDRLSIKVLEFPTAFDGLYSLEYEGYGVKAIDIPSGEIRFANLTVEMPTTSSGVEADTYKFVIQVKTTNGTAYTTDDDIVINTSLTLKLRPNHDVILYTGTNASYAKIGSSKLYTVVVENKGTENDRFRLSLNHPDYGDKVQFSIPLDQLTTPIITPGNNEKVNLTVEFLNGADPALGSVYCGVTAESLSEAGVTDQIFYTTTIEEDYAGDLFTADDYEEVEPGMDGVFFIQLRNKGTKAIDYFKLEDDDDHPFDNINIENSTQNIAANDIGNATITVSVPPIGDEIIPVGRYTINITAWSEGPTSSSDDDDVIVDNLTLTLKVLQVYAVRLTTSSSNLVEVDPGAAAQFKLKVKNSGNGEDDFDITVTGSNSNWVSLEFSSWTLGPDNTKTLNVTVNVPDKTAANNFTYNITAKSAGKATIKDFQEVTISVNEYFDVDLDSIKNNLKADPGVPVTFKVSIKNAGTAKDTFSLEFTGSNTEWVDAYGYMDGTMYIETNSIENVGIGLSKTLWINVTVPEEYSQTGQKIIELKATSEGADQKGLTVTDTLDLKADVQAKRKIVIDDVEPMDIVPKLTDTSTKAEVEYTITVTNDGTADDRFKIEYDKNNHTEINQVTVKSQTGTIASGASEDVTVTVSIHNQVEPTQCLITITFISEGDSTRPDVVETEDLELNIKKAYDLSLNADDEEKEATDISGSGDWVVKYNVTLGNLANTDLNDIEFTIEEVPSSEWKVSVSPEFITNVAYGANQVVVVTVKVTEDVTVGDYDIKIRATSKANYTSIDDSKVYDEITITTVIEQVYDIDLEITNPVSEQQEAEPGQSVQFTLKVSNDGNDEDKIGLKISKGSDPEGWASITSSKTVGADAYTTVTLNVDIPLDADEAIAGQYYINVTATSEDDSTTVEVSALVIVTRLPDLTLSVAGGDTTEDVMPGDVASFQLKVKNTGNARDTFDLADQGQGEILKWTTITPSQITLDPDTYRNVWVNITIPALEDVNDPEKIKADDYDVTVRVTSQNDDTKYKDQAFSITLDQDYKVHVSGISNSEITLDANSLDGAQYKFRVRNLGNAKDTFTFEKTSSLSSSRYAVTFQKEGQATSISSLLLDPNSEATVVATFKVVNGKYDPARDGTDIPVTVTVVPKSGQASASFKESLRFNVTVEMPDLVCSIIKVDSPEKGKTTTITVRVWNNGTQDAENVFVKMYADDSMIEGGSQSIKVGAGSTKDVKFDWKVTGEVTLKATVDDGEDIIESNDNNNEVTRDVELEDAAAAQSQAAFNIGIGIVIGIIVGAIIAAILVFLLTSRMKPSISDEEREAIREEESKRAKASVAGGSTAAKPERKKFEPVGKTKAKKAKPVKIQCPKCKEIQQVTDPTRPITVECQSCGKKLKLQ